MDDIRRYLETNPLLVDANVLTGMVLYQLGGVRYLLDNNSNLGSPTDAQLRAFGMFMNGNIQQSKHRLPILQAVTGNPLYTSTSMMTHGTISVLIDTMVDVIRVETFGKLDAHNEWEPSEWFRDVVPGIEHLIILEGGVCPPQFYREGIVGTEY